MMQPADHPPGAPAFSVVVPAYEASAHLSDALASLLGQVTCLPFEIIVVDDGSRDGSAAIAAAHEGVRVLRKENGGPASARNVGVRAAASDIVLFLDADDIALAGRLDRQARFMISHPDVAVSFGNWLVEGEPEDYLARFGLIAEQDRFTHVDEPLSRLLAVGCFVPGSASAVRRSAYLAAGGQPEDRRCAEDYALWCRLAGRGAAFACTGAPFAWYRTRREERLTLSPHTHAGLVATLCEAIAAYGAQLAPGQLTAAVQRRDAAINALLRHDWAYGGRARVQARIAELGTALPHRLRRKWLAIRFVPAAAARAFRETRVRLRRRGCAPAAPLAAGTSRG